MIKDLDELKARIESDPVLKSVYDHVHDKFERIPNPDPGHDLAHFLRVALWTVKIGGKTIDPCEGIIAALLHDIVPVPKDSPHRKEASLFCAKEAEKILNEGGKLGSDAIARISEAIRCHSFSRGEKAVTPLAQALQDADRLEGLGSIGIFRVVSTGVRMGAGYFDEQDPWASRRELDDRAYSVDHFFTKLLKLPETMTTEAGRVEARRRAQIMKAFLQQLGEELGIPAELA